MCVVTLKSLSLTPLLFTQISVTAQIAPYDQLQMIERLVDLPQPTTAKVAAA